MITGQSSLFEQKGTTGDFSVRRKEHQQFHQEQMKCRTSPL
jgi:hypothetical protein